MDPSDPWNFSFTYLNRKIRGNFSVFLVSLIVITHSAFAAVEKSTFDIKDNGEHCQALIEGKQTWVDVFANKLKVEDKSFVIKEYAVLHQSTVDGVCLLTGSKSIHVLSTKTGKVIEIINPVAVAENTSGTQIAIEYFDKGKRSIYFMDSDGKDNHVPFSNYSLSGLGYSYHTMKFTPDDAHLMIVEGVDFAEKMLLISASKAREITLKDIPAAIANIEGALTYIDGRIAVFVDDKGIFLITDFSQKDRINAPADHIFAGSFDDYLVFLNSKSMVLYDLKATSFGGEISIPAELSRYIQSNAVEYLELKPMKGKRFWLKTTDSDFYQFDLNEKSFKKVIKNAPCSMTGEYCL